MLRVFAPPVGSAGASNLRRALFVLPVVALLAAGCGGDAGDEARDERAAVAQAGAGGILVEKGCPECHSVERLGIRSASDIGPDLSNAARNVVTRYGRDLDAFFEQPSGTMQVVLAHQIQLTDAEQDSIVAVLTRLADPE